MAKLPPGNIFIPPRGMALRGVLYTTVSHGVLTLRSWPRKQPTVPTARATENRKRLAYSSIASLYMDAHQQEFSRELARRTTLNQRDLLMMALFGRIGTIVLTTGRKLYSMASVRDVSNLLDALSQIPGTMLYRGANIWQPIAGGADGDVLTWQPGDIPQWAAGAGGGASESFQLMPPIVPNIASVAFTTGNLALRPIRPSQNMSLTGVRLPIFSLTATAQAFPVIYAANPAGNGAAGGTKAGQGAQVTIAPGILSLPFAAPILLTANQWYWAGVAITGTGNITFMRSDDAHTFSYFAQTTATAPTTAPAITSATGNGGGWWLW